MVYFNTPLRDQALLFISIFSGLLKYMKKKCYDYYKGSLSFWSVNIYCLGLYHLENEVGSKNID